MASANENIPEEITDPVRLTKGIDIHDLVEGRGIEFEIDVDDMDDAIYSNNSYGSEDIDNLLKKCSLGLDCSNLVEDDGYDDASPFEKLAIKMVNVCTDDGKLKKRIVREGCGEIVPERSRVTIHYNGFLEYHDEPFDSTYIRKRPCTFELGGGTTIPGLNLAVSTMKLNEKSHFLIHPDFAYGKYGCMERIPENATLLFEIEVLKVIIAGSAIEESDDISDKAKFDQIFKNCIALQFAGKDQFSKSCYKQAVALYNKALSMLENALLEDMEDQNKQEDLRIKLFTNLAICYNKLNLPKKVCNSCNRVMEILRGTPKCIPAKIWFNKGKALIALSDFKEAQHCLERAQRIAPTNKEISQQLLLLQELVKKQHRDDALMAKKMFNTSDKGTNKEQRFKVSAQFEDSVKQACAELNEDKDRVQFNMAGQLTQDEQDYIKQESAKHNLDFCKYSRNGIEKFYISKKKEDNNK